jgi:hypothetical protein
VPLLIDRAALVREGIDPNRTRVSMPQMRTTYSLALRQLLFPVKMKFDVRRDEAGRPFLWITPLVGDASER